MIRYAKINYVSEKEAEAAVRACENGFGERLGEIADDICGVRDLRLITLTGPTCSGKTTAAKKLVSCFADHGKRVNIISIDDFYRNKDELRKISEMKGMRSIDYESADTIDLPALHQFVDGIFDRCMPQLHCPSFDFVRGERTGYRTIECSEDDVFVFEGIQVLYPQVTQIFSEYDFRSVYICAESSIDAGGIIFEANEIRLLRRLVRDSNFRGSDADFTFGLWQNVRHNEDVNIFPFADNCHYHIDSVFSCEISLLKPYLETILHSVGEGSPYYVYAQGILSKISPIDAIPCDLLSPDSLYHEFI